MSLKSGVISGAILEAIIAFIMYGDKQIQLIITWSFNGALSGGLLVLVLRVLSIVLNIIFKN
jgi:hypothetical protein